MSQKPPHLKAIVPHVAGTDMYELIYRGGIFHGPFIETWSHLVRDADVDLPAVPVDEDVDGTLLKAAIEQHGPTTASPFSTPPSPSATASTRDPASQCSATGPRSPT